jgi:ADP-ribosylglycohydrolase
MNQAWYLSAQRRARGDLDEASVVLDRRHEPRLRAGAYGLRARVSGGGSWRAEAAGVFGGRGSFGNGAAMRGAPIGAFFAPDIERVRVEALRSAEPTHAHSDGAAGAVAIAVAAALAPDAWCGSRGDDHEGRALDTGWADARSVVACGEARLGFDVQRAGEGAGTGAKITSQDTVPFAVWVAVRHLDGYEDVLWTATAHPGLEPAANRIVAAVDRDTVGAMVGGIVACATGVEGVPVLWREATERLPTQQSGLRWGASRAVACVMMRSRGLRVRLSECERSRCWAGGVGEERARCPGELWHEGRCTRGIRGLSSLAGSDIC